MPNYPPTTVNCEPSGSLGPVGLQIGPSTLECRTVTVVTVPSVSAPLPKTGGNDSSIVIFGGGVLLLGALVVAAARRSKEQ